MRSLQSDHALEARGCHPEGAQVVPGKERRNHERFLQLADKENCYVAQDVVLVEHEQMAQELFKYMRQLRYTRE